MMVLLVRDVDKLKEFWGANEDDDILLGDDSAGEGSLGVTEAGGSFKDSLEGAFKEELNTEENSTEAPGEVDTDSENLADGG